MDFLTASEAASTAIRAPTGKRLGGFVVDAIIAGAASLGIWVFGFFVILIFTWGDDNAFDRALWFLTFALSLLTAGYYIFFWITSGATPGKSAMGIRVIDWNTGRAPGLGQAAIRYGIFGGGPAAFSLLGFATGSTIGWLGTLWFLIDNVPLFFDPWYRALHDRAAGTAVVGDPPVG